MKHSNYNTVLTILFLLIFINFSYCQIQITQPDPIQGIYIPTDTIYMSPDGDDSHMGTFDLPVATFARAMSLLPYGTLGVNNQNSYGLIMMKSGDYITTTGFQQYDNNYVKTLGSGQKVYKNISIEGIGEVTIRGEKDHFATGQLLLLSGNHIFVKNVHLKYSNLHGLQLGSNINNRKSQITVENVHVDSVNGFSMFITYVDTILIKNSSSFNASRPFFNTLDASTGWPSGIKFYGCTHSTIKNSEIAYTRGEGLNFQNSVYCLAENNVLHDNFSNIYFDNSALGIARNNYLYHSKGLPYIFWQVYPDDAPTNPGTGILFGNEGSCSSGYSSSFYYCNNKCSFNLNNNIYYFNRSVDSIFVYNNIIQNSGIPISFFDGYDFGAEPIPPSGENCIRNVYITNNTIVGNQSNTESMPPLIYFNFGVVYYHLFLPKSYGITRNIQIKNNIFSFPISDSITNPKVIRIVDNIGVSNQVEIFVDNNLWSKLPENHGSGDLERLDMPYDFLDFSDPEIFRPCSDVYQSDMMKANVSESFLYTVNNNYDFITEDYTYTTRNAPSTNVGALEASTECISTSISNREFEQLFRIYPNPTSSTLFINSSQPQQYSTRLLNIQGAVVKSNLYQPSSIDVSDVPSGVYFLQIIAAKNSFAYKIIVP